MYFITIPYVRDCSTILFKSNYEMGLWHKWWKSLIMKQKTGWGSNGSRLFCLGVQCSGENNPHSDIPFRILMGKRTLTSSLSSFYNHPRSRLSESEERANCYILRMYNNRLQISLVLSQTRVLQPHIRLKGSLVYSMDGCKRVVLASRLPEFLYIQPCNTFLSTLLASSCRP